MTDDERVKVLEGALGRLLKLNAAADGRGGLLFALDTAMLGVLAALSPSAASWTVAPAVLGVVAAALALASLVLLAVVAWPQVGGPRGSLVFFEGIAGLTADQYEARMRSLGSDEYFKDLSSQVHRNAEIGKRKFKFLQVSMGCMFAAVPFWVVAVFMLYQIKSAAALCGSTP